MLWVLLDKGLWEIKLNSDEDYEKACRRALALEEVQQYRAIGTMSKISKEIVDKIEQRNALNEEITKWCKENLEMDGMDPDFADITEYHTGNEQGGDNCKEWCDQTCRGEDWYTGDYYWETEYEGKYLHMKFDV